MATNRNSAVKDGTEILLKIPLRWESRQGCIGSGDYVSAYFLINQLGFWREPVQPLDFSRHANPLDAAT